MKGLENRDILLEKLDKYIIGYEINDDHIKIIANNGDYRIVKNTEKNIAILNQTIIKNKINIAKKIDAYERNSTERVIILLTIILMIFGCGILIPFAFFTGSYILFVSSILVFSISVMLATVSSFNLYLLTRDIKTLKKATGYKKDREFNFGRLDVKSAKSHN